MQEGEGGKNFKNQIATSKVASQKLATTIIESTIPLLGFSKDVQSLPRGKMVRRFFAVCALRVVQQARFASVEQKQTATEALDWVSRAHRLE